MKPIRMALIGAGRGRAYAHTTQFLNDMVRLTAVCDANEAALATWRDNAEVRCFTDFETILADPDIDAICLATPSHLHAAQSIQALKAGKHVLCEVTAAGTLEEGKALIEAAKSSNSIYMMAENYCFFREILMVQNMVEGGVFGDLITAEGTYLHDCRGGYVDAQGKLSWRGALQQNGMCNWYPTHSLGPVCRWLDINHSDRLVSTATWNSGAFAVADFARRNFPADSPAQDIKWHTPDSMQTMIRTEKGVLIEHRLDLASPIPRPQNRYALQGTHASFFVNHYVEYRETDPDPQIWIADSSPTHESGAALEWESLWKYADKWEHPLWREHGEIAMKCRRDGGEYFTLREFASAIIEERPPLFDVYDAVTWSCFTPLSTQSMTNNNASIEVPDWKQLVS